MKLPKALEQYAREYNLSWDQFRTEEERAAREQWEEHVRAHSETIIVRQELRAQLVKRGAILPLENRPTLRLDPATRANPFWGWSVSVFLESLGWPLGMPEAEAA